MENLNGNLGKFLETFSNRGTETPLKNNEYCEAAMWLSEMTDDEVVTLKAMWVGLIRLEKQVEEIITTDLARRMNGDKKLETENYKVTATYPVNVKVTDPQGLLELALGDESPSELFGVDAIKIAASTTAPKLAMLEQLEPEYFADKVAHLIEKSNGKPSQKIKKKEGV